jgi:Sec-independent protein secretion pathway component TatC
MLLPGTDPVTMLISMAPLYALFEISLALAKVFGRPPGEEADDSEPVPGGAGGAEAA